MVAASPDLSSLEAGMLSLLPLPAREPDEQTGEGVEAALPRFPVSVSLIFLQLGASVCSF